MNANVAQNGKTNLLQKIEQVPASQVAALPDVADRFKKMYAQVHNNAPASEAFYEVEKFHFMKLMQEKPDLAACTKLSLYGCFMDVAVNGLSFDPTYKHLYVVAFSNNKGTRENPIWEKRATIMISGQGELLLRQRQGQIKYADNPVLVYEGDDFAFGTRHGQSFVDHIARLSNRTSKILACYMKIVRNDGSIDFKVITGEDMDRFRKFSKDPKSKAWVDGEAGMWVAKCIKHAFKNYPKLRAGAHSALQTDKVDEAPQLIDTNVTDVPPEMNVPEQIDYGVGDDQSFAQPEPTKNGATVTHDDDDF